MTSSGRPPLFQAIIEANNIKLISELLAAAAENINATDPTEFAVFSPNETTTNMTCLHYACLTGKDEIVKMVLSYKPDVNATNSLQQTPLHFASRYCSRDVVKLLIEMGATVNVLDTKNETPYMFSLKTEKAGVMQELIKNGADTKLGKTPRRGGSFMVDQSIEELGSPSIPKNPAPITPAPTTTTSNFSTPVTPGQTAVPATNNVTTKRGSWRVESVKNVGTGSLQTPTPSSPTITTSSPAPVVSQRTPLTVTVPQSASSVSYKESKNPLPVPDKSQFSSLEEENIALRSIIAQLQERLVAKDDKIAKLKHQLSVDVQLIDLDDLDINRKELGRGNFGVVYLAKWKGKQVAVKVVTLEHNAFAKDVVYREIQVWSSLKSDCFVQLYGYCIKNNQAYLVMEYANSGTLNSVIKLKKQLSSFQEIKRVALTVAEGVRVLHMKRLVHRDLKPDNILCNKDAEGVLHAKLADFGTAKNLISGLLTSKVGTPYYMAPEAFASRYDEKTDIYAFGVLLWEILAKKTPFYDWDLRSLETRIKKGEREDLGKVPAEWRQIIQICWDSDPKKRPNAKELKKMIKSVEQ